MEHARQFYINGEWVDPVSTATIDVVNPATEEVFETIAAGSHEDVDAAVAAAKAAFPSFSQTTKEERIALLEKIIEVYKTRIGDIASAVTSEMGAPSGLANAAQAPSGLGHFMSTLKALQGFEFEEVLGHDDGGERADRRVCLHHAMELAAQSDRSQGGSGHRRRLHDGAEAVRDRAAERHGVRRGAARGRRSRRCVQPRQRQRPRRWCSAHVASGRRHGVVHRLHPGGYRCGHERGTDGQAGRPGARRQVGQHHPRRCRRACHRWSRHVRHVYEHRPVLQRRQPDAGAECDDGRSHGGRQGHSRVDPGRRSDR